MSIQRQCDRCGAMEKSGPFRMLQLQGIVADMTDLCESCYQDLIRWLRVKIGPRA